MSETLPAKRCPDCGGALPDQALEGLCPKCLLLAAATPTDAGIGRERPVSPSIETVAAAFPHLEILDLIGQGGMGCVFKARQPQLNRLVALKILPESLARDEAFAARFTREAQALASLSHPNIVTIHDSGKAQAFFFLLMEFVDGVNLRQALNAGRFTPEQALAIVPPICDALQYAHERGIVHRDIKPENLLLDRDGRVKIADFGIAKMVGGENSAAPISEATALQQTALGTPQYMAPEQRDASAKTDHRADIYSLGVVLYELLTGELPGAHLQPPSRKVQVDVRLDEIVLRALETEPQRRYATAYEFKTSLQTVTVPEASPALPPVLPPKLSAQRVATLAVGLLLTGTMCVLLPAAFLGQYKLALFCGVIGFLLALVFGIAGWRERLGKIVVTASLLALLSAGITVGFLTGAIPASTKSPAHTARAGERGAPAADAAGESKRLRFEPQPGMANKTSWSVHPKPSFLNSNGWAVMARMTLGGVARIKLPGDGGHRCDITLVKGDDDGITVRIDDRERGSTMMLPLRRDQPGEITLDGEGYRVLFPTSHVAASDPDTSPFAHVIVTPVTPTREQSTTGQATPHFEPVKELVLGTNEFFSFQEGKVKQTKPEGGSAVLLHEGGQWLIQIEEMHAFILEKDKGIEQWNGKSAAELIQDYRQSGFALLPSERFSRVAIESHKLPLTFLLPGSGFLQVTERLVGEQQGVKLRYKLVQP